MASKDEVRDALFDAILKVTKDETRPQFLLALAEAFAWVAYPNQPHGSPTPSS